MNNEITAVKSFFKAASVHFSDEWLSSCIEWCKSENLIPNYTIKDLQLKIYEQWLITDLRDIEVPILPSNLSNHKHFVLDGNFCLQMMKVMDISKPKLWQLQKIRNCGALNNKTEQDSELVGTGKRMLQLTLTDGVQEVEAMEFRPVACLSLNLTPGVKIMLIGPVVIRRGRLMLESQNIKILGGEVDDLVVSNAAENVLARDLGLPENSNPAKIEEKLLTVEKEEVDLFVPLKVNVPKSNPVIPKRVEENVNMDEDMDELLLEAEKNVSVEEVQKSKTPDLFENVDFNDDDFDDINYNASTSTQCDKKYANEINNDCDVLGDIDIDAHLDEIDNKINLPKPNIITIAKLLENQKNVHKGFFKIKAKFKSIVEKLTVEDEYKLVIKIEDPTSDVTVKVHNDILSEFTGYKPEAILSLKSSILQNNEAAVDKVIRAMQQAKENILKMDHVMVIEVKKNEIPMIVKLL